VKRFQYFRTQFTSRYVLAILSGFPQPFQTHVRTRFAYPFIIPSAKCLVSRHKVATNPVDILTLAEEGLVRTYMRTRFEVGWRLNWGVELFIC